MARALGIDASSISRYERSEKDVDLTENFLMRLGKFFTDDEIKYIENGDIAEENSMVEDAGMIYGQNENSITLEYYPESYASAGGGSYAYMMKSKPMSFSKSFLELHLGLSNYSDLFILNTTGESMEPTLKDGSLIFVNPIENEDEIIRDGGIYVLMCENTMLVKRVRVNPIDKTYTLISDHPEHNNINIAMFHESGCRFIGRVVGSFDRI